ncbi:MAG TPA: DNA-binding protein WhiA [Firmicutes bacterium]|nr:DNA-binding protein WhiA [Bacillota bacterium]
MANILSFAGEVKEEIARHSVEDSAIRSLLSSFAKTSGEIHISGGKEELDLSTERANVAKFLYLAVREVYGVSPRFAYTKGIGFRKRVKYHCLVPEAEYILSDLQVDFLSGRLPKALTSTPEQAAAYLSGAFLASGSVNDPSSSNYHLEIALSDPTYANWISHLINRVSSHTFTSKVAKRRNQYIVYLKRSDQISDFLVLIGAPECCLKFENVRVDRDFANIGNRLSNLDGANLSKTLKASQKQVDAIEYFVSRDGWQHFDNPKKRLLMELRMEHKDASLDELREMLSERLASSVSKSNVNHLFRNLLLEYEKERANDGKKQQPGR